MYELQNSLKYEEVLTINQLITTTKFAKTYVGPALGANLLNYAQTAPIKKPISTSHVYTYDELMTGHQWSDSDILETSDGSDFESILGRSVRKANHNEAHKTALIISLSFFGFFFVLFLAFVLYRRWSFTKKKDKELFRPRNTIYCPVVEQVIKKKDENTVELEMETFQNIQLEILSTASNEKCLEKESSVSSINETKNN